MIPVYLLAEYRKVAYSVRSGEPGREKEMLILSDNGFQWFPDGDGRGLDRLPSPLVMLLTCETILVLNACSLPLDLMPLLE